MIEQISFKIIQALCENWNLSPEKAKEYLDLLAIGTGADLVSLSGENRIFMHFGLQKINKNPKH